jgi:hypothetical protein
MNYINPYELLNINAENLSDIDSIIIRKARTTLFHKIDLSISDLDDIGHIEFRGLRLTKADCIKIIDELDNINKKEFHFFIYQNKVLNNFLTDGNLNFFDNYKIESIYSLKEFIDFISPYFSDQYNKKLSEYFQKWDSGNTKSILSISPLVNTEYIDKCYNNIRLFIRSKIDEIKEIREKIEKDNEFINSDSFRDVYSFITKSINTKLINLLPYEQFQILRNTLGNTIQYLAVIVHNIEYDKEDNDKSKNLSHCFHIIEVVKAFECTGLEEKKIRDNYYILKKNLENLKNRIELDKKKPILTKYSNLTDLIINKIGEVDNETTTPEAVKIWANSTLNITEINQLDRTFSETKNEIALLLKSLSVSIWNKQDDIDIALFVLSKGIAINADETAKSKLLTTKIQLDDLKLKIESQKEVNRQRLASYKPKEKSGYGVLIGIAVVIFIIYLISSSNKSSNSKSNYTNNNYSTPQTTIDTAKADINTSPLPSNNYSNDNNNILEPVYTKVLMKNGNITDCSGIKPLYDNSISTKLIISAQMTDVAVKIMNYETNRCIRFVFVNDGTSYTTKAIPEGKYYLKFAYGNDWQVKEGEPVCKGRFTSHTSYKKDYSVYDFNKIYQSDGRVSIPYYTLKLYRTYTSDNSESNSAGNSISETDFNN